MTTAAILLALYGIASYFIVRPAVEDGDEDLQYFSKPAMYAIMILIWPIIAVTAFFKTDEEL